MDAAEAQTVLRVLAEHAGRGAEALEAVARAEERLAEVEAATRRAEGTRDMVASAIATARDEVDALAEKRRGLLGEIERAADTARATYAEALAKAKLDLDETRRLRAEEQERRSRDAKDFAAAQEKARRGHAQALEGMRQEIAAARRQTDAGLASIAEELTKARGVLAAAKGEHEALLRRLAGVVEAP